MSKKKQIAIILTDSLHRMGLYSLLMDYFSPINIVHFSSFEEISSNNEMYDMYFTDTSNYVMGLDYFLLRKHKTCILVNTEKVQGNSNLLPVLAPVETLIECLESMMRNDKSQSGVRESSRNLSSREVEVLKQVVKGWTNKEIADILKISLNTVLTHRKNITTKLGIKTVPGLTFYAIMNGIISGEEI